MVQEEAEGASTLRITAPEEEEAEDMEPRPVKTITEKDTMGV